MFLDMNNRQVFVTKFPCTSDCDTTPPEGRWFIWHLGK